MSAATAPLLRLRTDAHLLRRFRAGDDGAFAVLHARHADAVGRYVRGMLRTTALDPDDATQDVFVRAFEALRRDTREVEVRPWLFRVAHNRCVDLLRAGRPAVVQAGDSAAPAVTAEPEAVAEARDTLRALLRDIGRLPDRQRSALLLRELGGLSHVAVAEALGISEGASKMLVARARVHLAEAAQARDALCADVRERAALAADGGGRVDRVDRAHLRECAECRTCAERLERVDRTLTLMPAGGLGLVGLLASVTGGAAGKAAVVASCAAVCVGGASSLVDRAGELSPARGGADSGAASAPRAAAPVPRSDRARKSRRRARPVRVATPVPVRVPTPVAPAPVPTPVAPKRTAAAAPPRAAPVPATPAPVPAPAPRPARQAPATEPAPAAPTR